MRKGLPLRIHSCLILFIILALLAAACSSSELQTDKAYTPTSPSSHTATVKASITRSASPTPTLTPSPSVTPKLSFQLPPECQKPNSNIDPKFYSSYDFKSIPCEYPSISPDSSLIAFVPLAQVPPEVNSDEVVRVVRLFEISSAETIQIYESKCGFLYPKWTSTGHLVIIDRPWDVGCGYTVVYDPIEKKIKTILEGALYDSYDSYSNYWSTDKSAFFTLGPQLFGPSCSEYLYGFDLYSETRFPIIKPISPNTNIYVVLGEPMWMPDTKTLLATIRDGTCSEEDEYDCQYKNSYIVAFNFSQSVPKLSRPFYDPTIDYSFHKTDQGIIEFKSVPFESVTCWDIPD